MSNEIIKVLDELCARFGIAINWSSENVIPQLKILTEKLVQYELKTSIMWLVFGVVLIIIGISFIVFDLCVDLDGFGICIGMIAIITGIVVVLFQITDIIACNTFPEKIIIDHLRTYLKR